MGGLADGNVLSVRAGIGKVVVPGEPVKHPFPSFRLTFTTNTYARTKLTHPAPHPLHGEWTLTVYAWTR